MEAQQDPVRAELAAWASQNDVSQDDLEQKFVEINRLPKKIDVPQPQQLELFASSLGQPQAASQHSDMMGTPTVDLSHLTEEERLMIQSVMAKAEMADMGLPVDTSMPSSTNLPSQTSQALTQQRNAHQHQQQQRQQQIYNSSSQNQASQSQQSSMQQQHQAQNLNQHQPQAQMQPMFSSSNQAQLEQRQQLQQPLQTQQQPRQQQQPQTQQTLVHNQNPNHNNQTQLQQQQQLKHNQQMYSPINNAQAGQAQNQNLPSNQSLMSQLQSSQNQPMQPQPQQLQSMHQNPSQIHQQQAPIQQQQPSLTFVDQSSQMNQSSMQHEQQQIMQRQQQQRAQLQTNPMMAANIGPTNQQLILQQPQLTQQQALLDQQQQPQVQLNQHMFDGLNPSHLEQQQQQQRAQQLQPQLQQQISLEQAQQQFQPFGHQPHHPTSLMQHANHRRKLPPQPSALAAASFGHAFHSNLGEQTSHSSNELLHSIGFEGGQQQQHHQQRTAALVASSKQRSSTRQQNVARQQAGPRVVKGKSSSPVGARLAAVQKKPSAGRSKRRELVATDSEELDEDKEADFLDEEELERDDDEDGELDEREAELELVRESEQDDDDQDERAARGRSLEDTRKRRLLRQQSAPKASSAYAKSRAQACAASLRSGKSTSSTSGPAATITTPAATKEKPNCGARSASDQAQEVEKQTTLQLLGDLKLNEQANQVMEQQQLLIKQSQELIKLQQAQLEQRNEQERKAASGAAAAASANKAVDSADTGVEAANLTSKTNDEARDESSQQSEESKALDLFRPQPDKSARSDSQKKSQKRDTATSPVGEMADSEPDTSTRAGRSSSAATKTAAASRRAAADADADDDDDYVADSDRATRSHQFESSRTGLGRSTGGRTASLSGNEQSSARLGVRHHHTRRDLLLSPTDTTDSEIELTASRRRAQRHQQQQLTGSRTASATKPRGIVRRREPTGLPPSPLPVAAAIQLHQMQQQHFRNQPTTNVNRPPTTAATATATCSRNNFLRSRSVTSSPNHLLERASVGGAHVSGYMTDSQRARPSSPDTMSEYGGGQLRHSRRRLPQPPSNAVPLTPSMVRKMVQAQRAAAANSAKLPSSVNAQSTLLANAHSTRNPTLDRLPHELESTATALETAASRQRASYAKQSVSFAASKTPAGLVSTLSAGLNSTAALHNYSSSGRSLHEQQQQRPVSALGHGDSTRPASQWSSSKTNPDSDLDRFLATTFSNRSVLANSRQISDTKETPELDKLISNLDQFYGLEPKRSQTPLTLLHSSYAADRSASPQLFGTHGHLTTDHQHQMAGLDLSSAASVSGYPTGRPGYRFNSSATLAGSALARRSSEGEVTISSALARRDPYTGALEEPARAAPGAGLTSTSYLGSGPFGRPVQREYSLGVAGASRADLGLSPSSLNRYQSQRAGYAHSSLASSTQTAVRPQYTGAPQTPTAFASQMNYDNNSTRRLDPLQRPYYSSLADCANTALEFDWSPQLFGQQLVMSNSSARPRLGALAKMQHRQTSMDGYLPTSTNTAASRYYNMDNSASPSHSQRYQPNQSYLTSKYFNRSLELNPRDAHSQQLPAAANSSSPYRGYGTTTNYAADRTAYRTSAYNDNRAQPIGNNHNYQKQQQQLQFQQYGGSSMFVPLTKDDIINHGPKFTSIGYRFGTENQIKYVSEQQRAATECHQSRYPHPYKRILLSKNPKDRIGNGIGVQIVGGQPLPNVYDKANRCTIYSGAFVSAVFQSSSAHLVSELREGDQIIEWNGVNLCNRGNEEVQQILLSQFSDEEVEIVYLNREQFFKAYGVDLDSVATYVATPQAVSQSAVQAALATGVAPTEDMFDKYARMNRSSYDTRGHSTRYASEPFKDSIRRKLSLSSISHKWTR